MAFIGTGYVPCLLMFNFHGDSVKIIEEAKCKAYDRPKSHSPTHHSQDQGWLALMLDLHISQGPRRKYMEHSNWTI